MSDEQQIAGLLAAVEATFGGRLDEEGRANVRRQVERIVANSRALSAVPLMNDQEPDFLFAAQRESTR